MRKPDFEKVSPMVESYSLHPLGELPLNKYSAKSIRVAHLGNSDY